MRKLISLAAIALVTAAATCGPEPDPGPSPYLDKDNDGFAEAEKEDGTPADCDDNNAGVHPDAVEMCDSIDNDCDGDTDEVGAWDGELWYIDSDGDSYGWYEDFVKACAQVPGYVASPIDCDDVDPRIYPLATEYCDGVDNDCDGATDEGTAVDASDWYLDADEDDYGTRYVYVVSCNDPSDGTNHYVQDDDTDCNDLDDGTNPGADEICDDNGQDEDCDELINDADASVTDQDTWYADTDGDNHGDADSTTLSCEQPSGYHWTDDDCDDTDPLVSPSYREICGDYIDNDCDGAIDEEDAEYPVYWYVDRDGDGYGDPSSSPVSRCGDPGGSVSRVPNADDCDDTDGDISPGAEETWYDGTDGDCDGLSDYDSDYDGFESEEYGGDDCDDGEELVNLHTAEICGDGLDNNCDEIEDPCEEDVYFLGANSGDQAGASITELGDWDGDGYDDVAISADLLDESGPGSGGVYVMVGDADGELEMDSRNEALYYGEIDQDRVGSALAVLMDPTGVDYPALVIGAEGEDTSGAVAGAVYVCQGPDSGDISVADCTAKIVAEAADNAVGTALVGAGDLYDNDQYNLLVGAYKQDPYGRVNAGAAYVIRGPITSDMHISYADTKLVGETAGDWAGFSVGGGGDVNGDGSDDFLVGAPVATASAAYEGVAYLVLSATDSVIELADADVTFGGTTANDRFGYSVQIVGDTNSDGYADVLIGAPENDSGGSTSGAAYMFLGAEDIADATASDAEASFIGDGSHEYLGCDVAGAGDVDGNGYDDIIIGARWADLIESNAGAAYVFLAPMYYSYAAYEADAEVLGMALNDWAGSSVSTAGDYNGDGWDDFMLGLPMSDEVDVDAGMATLVFGGGW